MYYYVRTSRLGFSPPQLMQVNFEVGVASHRFQGVGQRIRARVRGIGLVSAGGPPILTKLGKPA